MTEYFSTASKMLALQEKLIHAIIKGDTEQVYNLVEVEPTPENPEPLVPDINAEIQDTPLILFAAKRKDWEILKALYNLGANIDVCDATHGWYLINEATVNAPDKIFETLVKECDLDVATRDGNSPLMMAIKNDKIERAKYILENSNVQISAINNKRENAGHFAIRKEQYDLFLELVKMGMPYDLKSKEGLTPLDLVQDVIVRDNLKDQIEKIKTEKGVRHAAGNGVKKTVVDNVEPVMNFNKKKEEEKPKALSGLSKIKRA